MKKWLFLLLVAAGLAGGAYYQFGMSHAPVLTEKNLTFAEVRRATIRDVVSATGLVDAREKVAVSSEASGTVMRLSGRVGDPVREGEELALLDDRRIDLKVKEAINGIQIAEAALKQAESASLEAHAMLEQTLAIRQAAARYLKVQEEVEKKDIGIRSEREQAQAQLDAAEAGIKAARAKIETSAAGILMAQAKKQAALTAHAEAQLARDMTRVKVLQPPVGSTPRNFVILKRDVQEGQMVGPQSGPLFLLAGSLDVVEVHAQVAEGDRNKIRRGLSAEFKIADYQDEDVVFPGTIKEIHRLATNIKGAVYYDAVIEVANKEDKLTRDWLLSPGMTAAVDIVRQEHRNAWRVPATALMFTLEDAYQTEAVKARVADWKNRPDAKDWQTLWVWDPAEQRPEPIFVRIGGVDKNGEAGQRDSEGVEILEWEAGKEPAGPLRIIIDAPKSRTPGFLEQPPAVKI